MSPSREQKYGNSALILLYATRVEGREKGMEVKRREGEGGGGGGGGGGGRGRYRRVEERESNFNPSSKRFESLKLKVVGTFLIAAHF